MAREPGYCLQKPSGKAYVNLGGKVHYLGVYGTDESKEKCQALKAEWLVNRHVGAFAPVASTGPSMSEVVMAFLEHASSYYTVQSVYSNLERAGWPIDEMYSNLSAKDFGVIPFLAFRDWWLKDAKRGRGYINACDKQQPISSDCVPHMASLKNELAILRRGAVKDILNVHHLIACRSSDSSFQGDIAGRLPNNCCVGLRRGLECLTRSFGQSVIGTPFLDDFF